MNDNPPLVGRLTPPANLTEALVSRLAAEIEGGRPAPGARLPTEQEIMAASGVSRTVVREAIAALRAQGLVVSRQGAGVFVSATPARRPFHIDPDEIHSLAEVLRVMELRLSIETEAAGLAAERRNSAQLAEIGRRLKAVDRAILRGEDAIEADFAFHQAIFTAADNPYFLRFLEFLGRLLIPRHSVRAGMGTPDEQRTYLQRIQAEHVAIHAAIRARQPEGARQAARQHLANSQERYRQIATALETPASRGHAAAPHPAR